MVNRTLTIALAASLAANVLIAVFVAGWLAGGAPPGHGPEARQPDMGGGRMLVRMEDVSPQTREAFRAAFDGRRDEMRLLFREARAKRRAFAEAMRADPWDRARIEAAQAELRSAETAHQAALSAMLIDAMETLSPDEREAVLASMERRGERGRRLYRNGERRRPPPPDEPGGGPENGPGE
jgi:uncharacterized membrane protein